MPKFRRHRPVLHVAGPTFPSPRVVLPICREVECRIDHWWVLVFERRSVRAIAIRQPSVHRTSQICRDSVRSIPIVSLLAPRAGTTYGGRPASPVAVGSVPRTQRRRGSETVKRNTHLAIQLNLLLETWLSECLVP
jgi:hypothetical protein